MTDGCVVLTGDGIKAYRLLALKAGLSLEVLGLRKRGRSCYSIIKEEFGLKGGKKKVLEQFEKILRDNGILK